MGTLLFPLLVGIEPVGGDPDLMYRPIKQELAQACVKGGYPTGATTSASACPWWPRAMSPRFIRPTGCFYRLFEVATAYRLSMWLHFVALAAATYAYARVTRAVPVGEPSLAALGFSLCGFQAVHAVHEPFYTLMPYVPLCLLLGDRYAATGRPPGWPAWRWPGVSSSRSGISRSRCGPRAWCC